MKRPLILLAATAVFVSACTDGGDGDDGSPAATGPPAATAVDISATEFAFDVPAEVTGGVVGEPNSPRWSLSSRSYSGLGGYVADFQYVHEAIGVGHGTLSLRIVSPRV